MATKINKVSLVCGCIYLYLNEIHCAEGKTMFFDLIKSLTDFDIVSYKYLFYFKKLQFKEDFKLTVAFLEEFLENPVLSEF